VSYYNPYWAKAIQNQQKAQFKPETKQATKQQLSKAQAREGFDPELLDKDVEVEQVKGANVVAIRGRVDDVSKYWLKLLVNGEVVYLNKAYIVSIKPLVVKDTAGGSNGGERTSRSK
jgi:hypothetical protein